MPEGGQSPPPERSTGKQLHDVPGSGKGTDDASHKEEANQEALKVSSKQLLLAPHYQMLTTNQNLTSNPRGPLEDEVDRKFAKTAAKPSS